MFHCPTNNAMASLKDGVFVWRQIQKQYFLSMSEFNGQLLITHVFSVYLTFWANYITGHWGRFRVKNATSHLHTLSWHFFCHFSSENLYFYHFHFLFWWSIEFPQQNINQSETRIGGKNLSVELYPIIY